jgi:uncharacterized metal-binding protein
MRISNILIRTIIGTIMIIFGIVLVNVNFRLPELRDMIPEYELFQMMFGITLLVIGFIILTKIIIKVSKRHYVRKVQQKSNHEIIDIFGLTALVL